MNDLDQLFLVNRIIGLIQESTGEGVGWRGSFDVSYMLYFCIGLRAQKGFYCFQISLKILIWKKSFKNIYLAILVQFKKFVKRYYDSFQTIL